METGRTNTRTRDNMQSLINKIEERSARVAIIGAGYVGLPLAVECASAGFETVAFEVDKKKVAQINDGKSYIGDVSDAALAPLVQAGKLRAAADPVSLGNADVLIICVPTPLRKTKDPDVSMIISASEAMLPHLRRNQLVVLESTTYPGFTREVLKAELERTGFKVGRDIALAFSPERVDPANPEFNTKNTPKVLGGFTGECTRVATRLYEAVVDSVVPVSSCDAAEMVKLLENTFRAVNIGLVNEVALMCGKLGLDTWEVIDAAATKPYGFMTFYPGPGLGGHCIPVDPHYLSWKLKTLKYNARFIELAGEINTSMPRVAVQCIADALNEREKPLKNSKVLIIGVAYKPDVNDVRESPALDVIELLKQRGAKVDMHDPLVESFKVGEDELRSVDLEGLPKYDVAVILTHHSRLDVPSICRRAQLVVDTRNATGRCRAVLADEPKLLEKVVKL